MPNNTYFDNVLQKIFELPLWVKQAIYAELKEHIKEQSPICALDSISKHNLIQLYKPFITLNGLKLIKGDDVAFLVDMSAVTEDIKKLLISAEKKHRIIDICQTYSWKLGKTCKTITDAITLNLIEPTTSTYISSTIYFLGGKIRIGEYLVRTGKITVEQLDMALYSQKYTEESMGERIYLAQILLNMSYITAKDYENIIFLKDYGDELYSNAFNENISDMNENVSNLQKEISFLRDERLKLRENLSRSFDDAHTIAGLLGQIDTLKKNLVNIKDEQAKAQKDLNRYVEELVSLTQENVELKEKIIDNS